MEIIRKDNPMNATTIRHLRLTPININTRTQRFADLIVNSFSNHAIASIIINGTNYMVSLYAFDNGTISEHVVKSDNEGCQTIGAKDFAKELLSGYQTYRGKERNSADTLRRHAKWVLQTAVFKECQVHIPYGNK